MRSEARNVLVYMYILQNDLLGDPCITEKKFNYEDDFASTHFLQYVYYTYQLSLSKSLELRFAVTLL